MFFIAAHSFSSRLPFYQRKSSSQCNYNHDFLKINISYQRIRSNMPSSPYSSAYRRAYSTTRQHTHHCSNRSRRYRRENRSLICSGYSRFLLLLLQLVKECCTPVRTDTCGADTHKCYSCTARCHNKCRCTVRYCPSAYIMAALLLVV